MISLVKKKNLKLKQNKLKPYNIGFFYFKEDLNF